MWNRLNIQFLTVLLHVYISVPVARPVMGDCENYNGSAIYMEWTPVPDDREHMKGRVKGYKVWIIMSQV